MKTNIPGIICVGWIALHIGMAIGMVGRHGDAFTVGWGYVATITFVQLFTAISAFRAGRETK